jgi:uncharacterized iron-regulated protein
MFRICTLVLLLAIACATGGGDAWITEVYEDHPLVGRIWDVNAGAFVEAETVADRAAERRYVLLGEKHDNPDHHVLQARMIRELLARGRRPVIVLEMITLDRSDALAAYLETQPRDADGLAAAVEWEKTGWPPWETYRPIADVALDNDLDFAAANLPSFSDPDETAGVPADVREVLTAEIRAGHCGHIPERVIPFLVEIQHARDAQLARVLEVEGEQSGAVLIAGAGHVRKWLAVPRFLEDDPPFVLAFIEVVADALDPEQYARGGSFDAIWFTPRLNDIDPCEQFRERLEKRFKREAE